MARPSNKEQILDQAVQMASALGVEGLSIGGLAAATHKSKGGICSHFPTKADLQVEVVKRAARMFRETVVDPIAELPAGIEKLAALTEAWFDYTEAEVFEGGCFFTNAVLELDDLAPTEALEAVRRYYAAYLRLLEACADDAARLGQLSPDTDPNELVLLLHGLEAAALVRRALGETDVLERAREATRNLLARSRA